MSQPVVDEYTPTLLQAVLKKITNLMSAGWHCAASFLTSRAEKNAQKSHMGAFAFLLLLIPGAAYAQEGNLARRTPPARFSLSASMQDTILKQGGSQDPAADLLVPVPVNLPPGSRIANLPGTGMKGIPTPKPILPQGNLKPLSASPDDDRPNSFQEEYNVSWAPWMAHLSSNWHEILKGCEEVLAMQFHTVRPALIQFTCYADGHIGNVILRQSSGIPVYDRLQIASLMEVRLLPFPQGTVRKSVTLIQGWESHTKQPGEQDFQPWNFANRFPQEKVSKWVSSQ